MNPSTSERKCSRFRNMCTAEMRSGSEDGSYLRLIDFYCCITRLWAREIVVSLNFRLESRKRKKNISGRNSAGTMVAICIQRREKIFVELMTSDRKLEASRQGSKVLPTGLSVMDVKCTKLCLTLVDRLFFKLTSWGRGTHPSTLARKRARTSGVEF